jgi:hypothetical protein
LKLACLAVLRRALIQLMKLLKYFSYRPRLELVLS